MSFGSLTPKERARAGMNLLKGSKKKGRGASPSRIRSGGLTNQSGRGWLAVKAECAQGRFQDNNWRDLSTAGET